MGAILAAGLARGHRGNPAASLRVHNLYCTPVLFSGLASLVLSSTEVKILDAHYQNTLQDLQRLHQKTPRSVILFMAGSLPGEAILHTKQLTLYGMICHLPNDPLNILARHVLTTSPTSAKSWFQQVRDLCLKYSLPHPLHLLDNPPRKCSFKALVKRNVRIFWETILTDEATELRSLKYFHPSQFTLTQPSLVWLTSRGNSFECAKSTIIAKMISGRYRSEDLCKHWSTSNKLGYCLAYTCSGVPGDLEHILVVCPALKDVRHRLTKLWLERSTASPALHQLIRLVLSSPPSVQVQFILDPTLFDGINMLVEIYGLPILEHVLYLTRTYAYYIHREKLIMLGRWPGDHGRRQQPSSPDKSNPIRLTACMHSITFGKTDNICRFNNVTNTSLVPGSVATNPAHPTITTPQYSYLTSHCSASGYANNHHLAKPGQCDSVGTQQCTTGHLGVPLGLGHDAVHAVWRGGQSGEDVESSVSVATAVSPSSLQSAQ